jgi:hypothetical protein
MVDIADADVSSATLEDLKWGHPICMENVVKVEGEGIEDTVETTNSIALEPVHTVDDATSAKDPATLSPENVEEDLYVRETIRGTCEQLLMKIEAVRLAVLHLQYSVHSGQVASVAVEAKERSQRLWTWDTAGLFQPEVSATGDLCLPGGAVIDIFDGGCNEKAGNEKVGNEKADCIVDVDTSSNVLDDRSFGIGDVGGIIREVSRRDAPQEPRLFHDGATSDDGCSDNTCSTTCPAAGAGCDIENGTCASSGPVEGCV